MVSINPKKIKGNIFDKNITGHELIICHQVNCKGVMGAGLAKQMRTKFPKLYEEYRRRCYSVNNSNVLLGKVFFYYNYGDVLGENYIVADIFAQNEYGREKCYTDYDALRKGLSKIREIATPLPARTLTTVRIPYGMGCGLAGGNWNTVFQIINEELVDYGIPVEIWRIC